MFCNQKLSPTHGGARTGDVKIASTSMPGMLHYVGFVVPGSVPINGTTGFFDVVDG
jgi:hypothetical protein